MVYVGIDFSLNSPGVCIQNSNGEYTFISFFNFGDRELDAKKIPKVYEMHRDLSLDCTIIAIPYNRQVGSKDFMDREREKLVDGKKIAELIISYIIKIAGTTNVKIALEGFSYGSTGNSFIDIVQYNTFLRSRLLNEFGADSIYIVQPSHVKKLAGKGNANKHFMAKAFQEDVLNDLQLRKTKLWNWSKEKDFSEKIPLPISDLIDSYFVLKTLA
jgi:hypothetical protein